MNSKQKIETEQKAIKYARWLAQRDGIQIKPNCRVEAIWGNHEFVQCVRFGAYRANDIIEIQIPHWDWKPSKVAA